MPLRFSFQVHFFFILGARSRLPPPAGVQPGPVPTVPQLPAGLQPALQAERRQARHPAHVPAQEGEHDAHQVESRVSHSHEQSHSRSEEMWHEIPVKTREYKKRKD